MSDSDQEYIWVVRWDDFQTYTVKRGKPWAPPWIKLYARILDDPDFLDLTPETRMLLVGLWALFSRTHGTVTKDTRRLSRQLSQRVTKRQLEALNHAGFIRFCSGTVREQFWNAFLNRSALEEKREELEINPLAVPVASYEQQNDENGETHAGKRRRHPQPDRGSPEEPDTSESTTGGTIAPSISTELARAKDLHMQSLRSELPDQPPTTGPPTADPRGHPSRNGTRRSLAPTRAASYPVTPIDLLLDTQPEEE